MTDKALLEAAKAAVEMWDGAYGYIENSRRMETLRAAIDAIAAAQAEHSASVPVTGDQLRYVARKEIDALLDHIYEYGTTAEGVHARIAAIVNKVESASVLVAFTEADVDEYVDGYVMGQDEACYTPNAHERFLIKDAIMGVIGTEYEQRFNRSASATSAQRVTAAI